MNFPVTSDKLSGLIRSYKDNGYPLVELLPSSATEGNPIKGVFTYNDANDHWCSTAAQGLNDNLVINFGIPFYITHYSIRSHPSTNHYIQAWTFEGSDDNKEYEMLHRQPICDTLKSSGIGQYKINNTKKGFRYFRIKQTVATISGSTSMRISGLDLYGSFVPCVRQTCSCKRALNYRISLIIVQVSH